MMVGIAVLFGVSVTLGLIWWWQEGRLFRTEESLLYCRCEECGQKIRYLATRAGRPAGCPRCKRRWILPETPETVALSTMRVRVGELRSRSAG